MLNSFLFFSPSPPLICPIINDYVLQKKGKKGKKSKKKLKNPLNKRILRG